MAISEFATSIIPRNKKTLIIGFPIDFLGFPMDFLGFPMDFIGFRMDFLGFRMDFLVLLISIDFHKLVQMATGNRKH